MDPSRTESGIVVTWLIQIVLVLAVVGLVLFDAGSIAWNYFAIDTAADEIALELSEQAEDSSARELEAEAISLARERGARLVKGSLVVKDDKVTIKLRREATTIVVGRIGAIEDWGKASATGSAATS